MGDRLAMVAFPWLVYRSTHSTLSTGSVFALYTLPYVLFGTFAGAVIDRFNKRTVMVVADLLRVGLALLVPLAATRSLPAVYVLSFAIASAAVFFDPCKLAIVPDIVGTDRLLRANSLLASGENLTEILGFALAGLTLLLRLHHHGVSHRCRHFRRVGRGPGCDALPRAAAPWPCRGRSR